MGGGRGALGRLLGSRHVDDEGAVCGATDLEGPWAAADVAVPNELTFALRVDVDVDVLEAVGASDSRGVVHWGARIHEGACERASRPVVFAALLSSFGGQWPMKGCGDGSSLPTLDLSY